jgi:tRNA pseudouridine38-40 synthase
VRSTGAGRVHTIKPHPDDRINIKLTVEYDGSKYFGWQRQKDKPSVQEKLESSIALLLQEKSITLNGAGRTDAGVHAYNQAANFRISKTKYEKFGAKRFLHSLNAILPPDIAVKKAKRVPNDFHARYSAKGRIYKYYFAVGKRPIEGDRIFELSNSINLEKAGNFCKHLTGLHSFRSLCKNKTDDHGFNCKIEYAGVKKKRNGIYEFEIKSNRFLHSMVRAVVGAMIKIASGRMELKEFREKFKKGDEIKIQFVPAKALFLSKVIY